MPATVWGQWETDEAFKSNMARELMTTGDAPSLTALALKGKRPSRTGAFAREVMAGQKAAKPSEEDPSQCQCQKPRQR